MSIKNIGIIGSGIMGSGIAQVSAAAGYQIVIQDISKDALEKILYTTDLKKACENADLIVEAVFENLAIKHELFQKVDELAKPEAILASNTSALPITEIASVTDRGQNFVGIHFMNPVALKVLEKRRSWRLIMPDLLSAAYWTS
jgi:3-hydroxybutyryl-CoA dehydrogenase